jgi:hypothetical protein
MTEQDAARRRAIGRLRTVFPQVGGRDWPRQLLEEWARAFDDIAPEVLDLAVSDLIAEWSESWPPYPGHLLARVRRLLPLPEVVEPAEERRRIVSWRPVNPSKNTWEPIYETYRPARGEEPAA